MYFKSYLDYIALSLVDEIPISASPTHSKNSIKITPYPLV